MPGVVADAPEDMVTTTSSLAMRASNWQVGRRPRGPVMERLPKTTLMTYSVARSGPGDDGIGDDVQGMVLGVSDRCPGGTLVA